LLIDCDEPSAVDRILEELLIHGEDADYREDLLALVQLLEQARDPEREEKILQVLNNGGTPKVAAELLEVFLKNTKTQRHKDTKADSPWFNLDRVYAANKRYIAAAKLFDAGKKPEASRAIDEILKEEPRYPLALMLKGII
jgi:hypothetical protein